MWKIFNWRRDKLPQRIALDLDQEEVAALCAAIPFAFREARPDHAARVGHFEAYDAARRELQGPLAAAFQRVLLKLMPYGKRYDELGGK